MQNGKLIKPTPQSLKNFTLNKSWKYD